MESIGRAVRSGYQHSVTTLRLFPSLTGYGNTIILEREARFSECFHVS